MKKLVLVIIVFYSLSSEAQTSVYHPLPDSNAIWNITFASGCMIGCDYENYSIILAGDTLINTVPYHKLFIPYVQADTSGGCGVTHVPGYKGAIRQDTANRKVYFIPPLEATEQLLYDFTLQVGDTVKGYLESFAFPADTVSAVDSILVGDTYRKRWEINICYGIYIMEGIGSTYGLIEKSPGCVTDMDGYLITCFSQDGKTIYPDTNYNCQLITNINSVGNSADKIKIYPNPAEGRTCIDLGKMFSSIQLVITDETGKVIERNNYNNINHVDLNIEKLKGVYFIELTSGPDRAVFKMMSR